MPRHAINDYMTNNKQLEQVKLFMNTFGQKIELVPTLLPKTVTDLRISLSQEELNEYAQACEDGDLVEIADALTDRLYVLLGDFLAHGMGDLLEPLFDEVQRSNMSKLDKDGNVLYRADGKILKSDLFTKPSLEPIVRLYTAEGKEVKVNPLGETIK
jgi:predicted HAD superfamily Cof-like phosphohydrolase